MRDGSCMWRAAAIGTLLAGLSHSPTTAQDYYHPPVPSAEQGQTSATSYNAMLDQLERRVAMLETNHSADHAAEGCREIEIQTQPNHRLRGRVYADQIWMDDLQGPGGAVFPEDNFTGFDTVRLGVTGNIYENLKYIAEVEFEGDEVDYKDVYAEQSALPWVGHLRIGHFKEYAGLEQMTSSRYITFMKRSAPTVAFTPARNWGLTFYNHVDDDDNFSWYAGLFRGGFRDNYQGRGDGFDDVPGDHNDWAATVRAAWLPYYDAATPGRCLVHVGGWVSFRRSPEGTEDVGGNGQLEGFLELDSRDGPLDAHVLPNTENNVYGLELAYMRGPFFIQGEAFGLEGSVPGGSDVDPWGAYVTVGYFLTGENRGYKKSSKAFDRVEPFEPFFWVRTADGTAAGWGAWEVAARWSYLDISDVAFLAVNDVTVGYQENITLGVNWYWNPYTRLMLNYVHSISDVTASNENVALGKYEGDHVGVRFQIDW